MATVRFLQTVAPLHLLTATLEEDPFLKDEVFLNTQAGDFTFSEEATPLAPGDSSGATSQFTVRGIMQGRTDLALDRPAEFVLDNGERLLGIVRHIQHELDSDVVLLTLDGLLNLFNTNVRLPPSLDVTFEDAMHGWALLVNIDSSLVYVDPRIAERRVNFPGNANINLWDAVKQVCTAYGFEAYSTGANIGFRLPGEIEVHLWGPSNYSHEITRQEREEKVVIKAYHNSVADDQIVYISDQVFEVKAGETVETVVSIEGSIISLNPPSVVSAIDFEAQTGQYVVTGSDGYIIAPALWDEYGGRITAEVGDNFNEIKLKFVGAAMAERSPFRISEGAADRPALRLSGSGLLYEPEDITLVTGIKGSSVGVPPEIDNPYLSDTAQVWDRGIHTAQFYGNADMRLTISGVPHIRLVRSIPGQPEEELVTRFGYFAGAVCRYRDAMYRVTVVSYTPDAADITMVEYTTIDDFNAIWADQTFEDFEAAVGPDMTFAQFGIRPLTSSSP